MLEERVCGKHCSPLVKLFKFLNSDALRAHLEGDAEMSAKLARLQELKASLEGQVDKDADLSVQLRLTPTDEALHASKFQNVLDGVSCADIDALFVNECFSATIFSSFLKLLNCLHEVKLDCSRMSRTIYEDDGGADVPTWAADAYALKQEDAPFAIKPFAADGGEAEASGLT